MNMAFCQNCGHKIDGNAKFCQECGTVIEPDSTERRTVYAGEIHKCPNCGEVLDSFVSNCPSCSYEIRGAKTSSAIKEFASKLAEIDSKSDHGRFSKAIKTSLNIDSLTKNEKKKVSLIKNFIVPNSKEDMLEFIILATSSINYQAYDFMNTRMPKSERHINDAWYSKVKQVYEKVKIINPLDNTFVEIKKLFDECNSNIKKAKKKAVIKVSLLFGWIPLLWLILIFGLFVSEPKDEAKEIERLENIVVEVQAAIDNKEYKHALRIADSIDYQRNDEQMERKWDIQRAYWVDKVIEVAEQEGVVLEYTPKDDIDKSNDADECLENDTDDDNEQVTSIEDITVESVSDMKVTEKHKSKSYRTINVKNFTFDLPDYWSEEGSKNEYLQYYAQKGESCVMFSIGYPLETDNDYDVSFEGLYADNENMVETISSWFTEGDVIDYEPYETKYGVKGILYCYTYNQEIDWLKSVDASGYCFCFPSEEDRRWFYICFTQTNNVPGNDFKDDYMLLISNIRKKS